MAPPTTLADWLDYQQTVHARGVDLGLDRVRQVWLRLGSPQPAPIVITVAGTNGKGSTVAFLDAMLRAAGRRVGTYTSPHLLDYNERVRIDGTNADDAALIDAFARIEAARGDTPLTYFEYGTLAALWIFAHAALDVAVLEVGLGGRLDAVNLIDADVAVVTTIDLDHQDWLGNDRDAIGREKAGVLRVGRPAIVGEATPAGGLLREAARIGATLVRAGIDYRFDERDDARTARVWSWSSGDTTLQLPAPALLAPCQRANAAAAIAALYALRDRLGFDDAAIARGVVEAKVDARLQRFESTRANIELIVDVAHNPQAARMLADWLRATPTRGRTIAVFGALADKDVAGIVAPIADRIDVWHLAALSPESPRGLDAGALRALVNATLGRSIEHAHDGVQAALAAAMRAAAPGDRVIAFGSFFIAAAALRFAAAADGWQRV